MLHADQIHDEPLMCRRANRQAGVVAGADRRLDARLVKPVDHERLIERLAAVRLPSS